MSFGKSFGRAMSGALETLGEVATTSFQFKELNSLMADINTLRAGSSYRQAEKVDAKLAEMQDLINKMRR